MHRSPGLCERRIGQERHDAVGPSIGRDRETFGVPGILHGPGLNPVGCRRRDVRCGVSFIGLAAGRDEEVASAGGCSTAARLDVGTDASVRASVTRSWTRSSCSEFDVDGRYWTDFEGTRHHAPCPTLRTSRSGYRHPLEAATSEEQP